MTNPVADLVLVHLSDIHFREEELISSQDLDLDIRKKLLADLREPALPTSFRAVDGILITGDIAFAAKKLEYEAAHLWLRKLCQQLRCDESRVFVVPGNHDVCRTTLKNNRRIRDMHELIRQGDSASRLRERLMEEVEARALLEPFAAYNNFAKQLEGQTRASQVWWESDELLLNDGSVLRIRGLNSALISDATDDAGTRPWQVLGERQVQLDDDDAGVAYVTLCHHPPRWLYDEQHALAHLKRAKMQLFGHEHSQRVEHVDGRLVVYAGALHPERKEREWEPRYNILAVRVDTISAGRTLHVTVYPRVWRKSETRFGSEPNARNEYPFAYQIPLSDWSPPLPVRSSPAFAGESQVGNEPGAHQTQTATELRLPTSSRRIVYDFFELSFPRRMQILLSLDLLVAEDDELSAEDLIRRAIERAATAGKLDELAKTLRTEVERKP